MLKLLGGRNTVGKTRYLRFIYNKMRATGVAYYGVNTETVMLEKINMKKVSAISDCFGGSPYYLEGNGVRFEDISSRAFDRRVLSVVDFLCKGDNLILLDEIDLCVHELDIMLVYETIKAVSTVCDVVLVTHDVSFTWMGDEFYTVSWRDGRPLEQELTREEFEELVYGENII